MQKNQLTIGSVAESLRLWRANKSSPYAQIPENIKNSIKSLAKHYTYTQLAKGLGSYAASLTKTINNNNNKFDFIELPTTTISNAKKPLTQIPTSKISCTLQHSNGATMLIEISNQQLSNIIKDFIYALTSTTI